MLKPQDIIDLWKNGDLAARVKIGGGVAIVFVVLFMLVGGGKNTPQQAPVRIQQSGENVMLNSVFQHGKIDEYSVREMRKLNASGLADGVFLVTIQTHKDLARPMLTSCILIKDEIGYDAAGYAISLFDCDSFPEIRRPEDKIEVTPISVGDLLKDTTKGFYEITVPKNVIPGYEHEIRCFALTHTQGALGVFTGYGGMSCEFGEKAQR